MAQEVVKGTGGGAQKGQGEARCQGVCNKGAKEMNNCGEFILLQEAIETIFKYIKENGFPTPKQDMLAIHIENILDGVFTSGDILKMREARK